jgi:hypothetical protein
VCTSYILCVKITLIYVKVCLNHTLQVKITFVGVMKFCVHIPYLCVCWNHTLVCENVSKPFSRVSKSQSACRIHAPACPNPTQASWNHILNVKTIFVRVKVTLLTRKLSLYVRETSFFHLSDFTSHLCCIQLNRCRR